MATREEIYEAIRNAGKAGDGDAVRALGAYLQTMDKQAPDSATEKKTGMLAALGKGTEGVVSSTKTALQSMFGDATEAGKQGLERGAKSQYADQIGLDKLKEVYAQKGFLPAVGEVGRQIPLAVAEQAPNLAASLASARLGAMGGAAVGSVVPGLGTGVGALVGGGIGAFAPSLLQQMGGDVQRQVQETGTADAGKAATAAVPQAVLDVAGNYIPLGKTVIGKMLGPEVTALLNKGSKEAAEKLAKESLTKAIAKGTAIGAVAEIPTEVAQSAIERLQAGLPLLTEDALKEYGETAYQSALLAPVGGAGRLVDRSAAKAPAPAAAPGEAPVASPINAALAAREERMAQEAAKAAQPSETDISGKAVEEVTGEAPTEVAAAEVPPPKVRKKGAKNVAVPPVVEPGEATAIEQVGAGATVPSVGVDSQPDAVAAPVQTEAAGVGVSELPVADGNAPEGLANPTVTVGDKTYTVVDQDEKKFAVNNGMKIPRTGKLGKAIEAQLAEVPTLAVEAPAAIEAPAPAVEAPAAIEAPAPVETQPQELASDFPTPEEMKAEELSALQEPTAPAPVLTETQTPTGAVYKAAAGKDEVTLALDDALKAALDSKQKSVEFRQKYPGFIPVPMLSNIKKLLDLQNNPKSNPEVRQQAKDALEENFTQKQIDAAATYKKGDTSRFNAQALNNAVPTPEGFAETVEKGQTRKALQVVLNNPQTDNITKLVIRSALKAGTLPKLSVVPSGTFGVDPETKEDRVGRYDPVADSVELDAKYVTADNLIHELIHGFLHRKVADYVGGVHKDAQIKRIDDLFQYLKTNNPELAEYYGMTDLSEFVSEAMSNGSFQEQLKAIPYKKGSFFSEFAKAVLKLLGINDTTPKWNALAEALISTESVMQSGRLLQEARTGIAIPQVFNGGDTTQTRTPAFKRWFGDSKVVDENGEPLVVYTGTSKDEDFSVFKAPKNGIWFTDDPSSASLYAKDNDSQGVKVIDGKYTKVNTASRVMPVYLSITNPMVYEQWPDSIRLATNYKSAQGKLFDQLKQQGYDGVIMGGVYVAFNNKQIKSAIGNSGAFDPKNPDIRYNINTPGAVAAAASANVIGDTTKRSVMDDIKRAIGNISGVQLIDRLRSIDAKLTAGYLGRLRDSLGNINPKELLAQALDAPRLVERALVEGGLSTTQDGMFAASDLKMANGEQASLKRIVEIIAASAKQKGWSFDEENKVLSALIVGHREFELDKYNNAPTTPVPIQLRIVDSIKRNDLEQQFQANASAQKVLEIMDAMRFNRIDMMVYSGRISQDKADFWKSTLGYVPYQDLDRLNERINASKTGSGKGLANTSKFMRLEGKEAQVNNVVESFVDLMSRMTLDAVKVNAVNRSAEAMRLLGHAKRISPAVSQSQAEKEHTLDTFINGKPARFYFDDPLDAAAFGALPTSVNSLVQLAQSVARVLRAGVTLVPGFAVGQVLTDLTRAYALSDVSKPAALIPRILMNFPLAAYGELTGRKGTAIKRLENMGVAATFDVSTQGTIKNIMQEVGAEGRGIVGSILHFAEAISKGSDIAVRKAIYEQSLEETKDEALSISRAREIINFSRRGKNDTVDFLVRTVPFTNAYIRGMDKLYTAATGTSGAYGMTQKEARSMFRNRIGTLAAMGFVYAAMMAGDEEYESLDDSIRDSRIILPFKIDGAMASIPLPRDLAFMFKAIPERIVNYVRKYGTEEEQNGMLVIGELLRQGLLTIASPSVIPSAVTPVIENITNKSFFLDRPLESQSQQSIDASLRYGRGTSEVSKEIGNGLAVVAKQFSDMGLDSTADMFKVSPIKIENLIRGWFGTSAALALAMGDSMLAPERTAKSPHKEVLAQITGVSAMMTDPVGRKQLNEFYDLYDKMSEFKKSLSKLEKTDPEAAIKYGRERGPEMEVADYMEILHKDIQELNAAIRLIDSDKDMGADEKLKAVSLIVKEQNEIAKETKSIKRHLLKRE